MTTNMGPQNFLKQVGPEANASKLIPFARLCIVYTTEETKNIYHMHTFQNPYVQVRPSPKKLGFICKRFAIF